LRVRGYLGDSLPPLEHVTSVRGVVFRNDEVLVMRDPDEVYMLPGGQREAGARGLEVAGWEVEVGNMIGCTRLHHPGPKPPVASLPYSGFMQIFFLAGAARARGKVARRL